MKPIRVPEDIQAGTSFKLYWGENNPNNKVFHVLAIVDDVQVVCKRWPKHVGRWVYYIESMYFLELVNREGALLRRKK